MAHRKWNVVNEDEWDDLECPYKACQTAKTVGGFFTDTGINEWDRLNEVMMNDNSDNDNNMRNVRQVKSQRTGINMY